MRVAVSVRRPFGSMRVVTGKSFYQSESLVVMPKAPIKVLIATRTSPFAGESGSGAYVFDVMSFLARKGFKLHVVWTQPPDLAPGAGWYVQPAASRNVCSLEIAGTLRIGRRFWQPDIVWLPAKARASHVVKTSLQRLGLWRRRQLYLSPRVEPKPVTEPKWGSAATTVETICVRRAISRWRPDVVLANYAWMAPTVRPYGMSTPPFAVLTLDVRHRQLHLRDGRVYEELGEHTSIHDERQALATADAVIAIQKTEAAVFSRLLPNTPVITARMSAAPCLLPLPSKPTLLFVGSGHAANVAGLGWFLNQVWPLVLREVSAASLFIAGGICSLLKEALPDGVIKLGHLGDLSPAYAQSSIVIAPLLQGSGLKIKILEAISFGRACVTTSVGAEGLEDVLPALCIADKPVEFANAMITLLSDPVLAAATRESLLARARAHLSPESCYTPLVDLLRSLSPER